MIKYYLVESHLAEHALTAVVQSISSLDQEAVIDRILKRGTLLTRTNIIAVLNAYNETVVDLHLQGYSVTLPLFNTSFSISGVFDSQLDAFDGNRHKLNVNLSKGLMLRNAERSVKFEKTNTPAALPLIHEIKDSVSESVNEKLTANGVVEVRGYHIKIEGFENLCGLWFISETGETIKAKVIVENKPSKIIAMIPNLTPGNYHVKIVTQFAGGGVLLKTPKEFIFPKNMIVG